MKQLLISTVLLFGLTQSHAETVKVYAAASLSNALTDIKKIYEKQHTHNKVVTVFAASSILAKQIENGASSDLYFSADLDWMNYLIQKQRIHQKSVKPLLYNQLVVISSTQAKIQFKPSAHFNFANVFKGRLCTGQMESVPVGKYAKQSLIKLNWLTALQGRIVGTDDVRSALAFVERGECTVGIVYKTDAMISKKVKVVGTFPSDSHQPIIYPIALTVQGSKNIEAIRFFQFVHTNPEAKKIFVQYGFGIKK